MTESYDSPDQQLPEFAGQTRSVGQFIHSLVVRVRDRLIRLPHYRWRGGEPLWYHGYRYPMLWMLIAMLLGVQLGQRVSNALPFWGFGSLACLLVALIASVYWVYNRIDARLAVVPSLAAVVLFGYLYSMAARPSESDSLSDLAQRQSHPIALRAVVNSAATWKPNPNHRPDDPSSEPWSTHWDIICDAMRSGDRWQPIHAQTRLTVPGRIDRFLPGDYVQIFGQFHKIIPPTNPGAYDYASRAKLDENFVAISTQTAQQVEYLSVRNSLLTYPNRIRAWLVRELDRNLHRWVSFEQAPLAAALVFGQREQVDWEDQQELMTTGTLHLLAISGMHVGIVAGAVLLFCAWFNASNRTEFLAIAVVCGLYAAIAGGKPPVMRAALLISATAYGRLMGRNTRLANSLALAALLLLLIRVSNIYDVGVHLSFLAVASISVFAVDRSRKTERRSALQAAIEESYGWWYRLLIRWARRFWEALKLSFWVWLITSPLIWLNFNLVAPVGVLLNILIAIPLSISLLSGLATALLGWVAPVGFIAGLISGSGLVFIIRLIELSAQLPLSHFWLPPPSVWWIVTFYVFTISWLLFFGKNKLGILGAILCIWLAMGIMLFATGPRGFLTSTNGLEHRNALGANVGTAELRCTFLDVGHGTSVIIELPTGEVWLYDAGRIGSAERSHERIASALWNIPTARIDTLVLSHADADHYNATRGLLKRFEVGTVVSTRRFWECPDRDVEQLIDQIEQESNTPMRTWEAPKQGSVGSVQWTLLHPQDSTQSSSDNASSICLLFEYAGKRILLPGDLEEDGLLQLTELPPRPCHVVMAPHHGSLTQDPTNLIEWCRPDALIISGNHKATRSEVLKRFTPLARQVGITFRDGAIQVRINASGALSLWRWRENGWLNFDEGDQSGR